ncbi:MAG: hypothetical protein ACYTF9_15115, partial [Planctomycetota bacterium]
MVRRLFPAVTPVRGSISVSRDRLAAIRATLATLAAAVLVAAPADAQTRTRTSFQDGEPVEKFDQPDRFRQLEELLPTPNEQRAASG